MTGLATTTVAPTSTLGPNSVAPTTTAPAGNLYRDAGNTHGYTAEHGRILARTGVVPTEIAAQATQVPLGSLTVTKTIGGTAAGQQGEIRIEVTCDGVGLDPFIIPAGSTGTPSRTYDNLVAGSTCTITETVDGSSATVGVVTVPAGAVTISPGITVPAAISDEYTNLTTTTTTTTTAPTTTAPTTPPTTPGTQTTTPGTPPTTVGGVTSTASPTPTATTGASRPSVGTTAPGSAPQTALPTTDSLGLPSSGPSVPSAPGSPEAELAACEERAHGATDASLAFQPRRKMVVNEPSEVDAVLALNRGAVGTGGSFPGTEPTTIVPTGPLRCTVEAELTGDGFTIVPSGPRTQSFLESDVLRWQWQVTPLKSGRRLVLTIRMQPKLVTLAGVLAGRDRNIVAEIEVNARGVSLPTRAKSGAGSLIRWVMVFVVGGAVIGVAGAWAKAKFGPRTPG